MLPQFDWRIVTTEQEFHQFTSTWTGPIAADVETAKDAYLLGVSLSNGINSVYVPVTEYSNKEFLPCLSSSLHAVLKTFLAANTLIGHNFTYDKRFIDSYFGVDSKWCFDTRIGWHLASAPSGPRPYGLKDAQKDLLGWEESGEKELKREVEARGGKLSNGDHYLGSTRTLGKYACLDTLSTYRVYSKLKSFFVGNDYFWMMDRMMSYQALLETNTRIGIHVDRAGLQRDHDRLLKKAAAAKARFLKLLPEIQELEEDWKDRKLSEYKREYNKVRYLAHPEVWKRFNFNSDSDKRELFFDKLGLPVVECTPIGLPSASADSLVQSISQYKGTAKSGTDQGLRISQALEAYLKYEKANTLTTNFSRTYLDCSANDNRLHPGFNICGTVSYRLSGFKPYLLNAPFDETLLMQHLQLDAGYIGVHSDLSAIEPTITAHYSEDASLQKVFGRGLGDIYLDLALELFPWDQDLKIGYNPNIPITEAVKKKFSKQRKVAKVIQLAVQYTGTEYTVSRNLTKQGFPTTVPEAKRYVQAYWRKFHKVEEMNRRLREINRGEGHLRNVMGRIIQVPDPEYKDLPNRFIQSSAHDVLILWVGEIYRLCKEQGVEIRPVLLDCHDSTSNAVPIHQADALKQIYSEALATVNTTLALSVTIRAETKTFSTLAGLKADE